MERDKLQKPVNKKTLDRWLSEYLINNMKYLKYLDINKYSSTISTSEC